MIKEKQSLIDKTRRISRKAVRLVLLYSDKMEGGAIGGFLWVSCQSLNGKSLKILAANERLCMTP